jgi:tripartite-type tricarboxylate transporter receptor subunit TctC
MKKLILMLTAFFALTAHAQFNPTKEPIKAVIPFAPGGGTDIAFRHFQKYADQRNITIVPMYKGGADGLIGTNEVAESKPNGYTIGFATVATVATHKLNNPNYNFDHISVIKGSVMAIATHPNNDITNFDSLEKTLKSGDNKKTFAFGSPSQKTIWEQIFNANKISIQPVLVPYKGGGPAVQDAIGGHVDFIVVPYSIIKQHVDSGKLRLIAIIARNNWKEFSHVPNVAKKYNNWQFDDGFLLTLPQHTNTEAYNFWKEFVLSYMKNEQVNQDFVSEYTEIDIFGIDNATKRVDTFVKTLKDKK